MSNYEPGDWALPKWWTDGPPRRMGSEPYSYQELESFYSSPFVRNVLGHEGGITTLPTHMDQDRA